MQQDDTKKLVFDLGSGSLKGGFAGDDVPMVDVPPVVGYSKKNDIMNSNAKSRFVGDEVYQNIGFLDRVESLHNNFGNLNLNGDTFENIMHDLFHNYLKVDPKEHPTLYTLPILSPNIDKEKTAQILFEKFNVPALHSTFPGLLSAYGYGFTTCFVIDLGARTTQITPIYFGDALVHAFRRQNFGGEDVKEFLFKLSEQNQSVMTKQVRQEIKETKCEILLDFEKDYQTRSKERESYNLPDGRKISLGSERFLCGESLFKPYIAGSQCKGLIELITDSISSVELDCVYYFFHAPRNKSALVGGSSKFKGIYERIVKDVNYHYSNYTEKFKINPTIQSHLVAWSGGSILASLDTFQEKWETIQEYNECGPTVFTRKFCF